MASVLDGRAHGGRVEARRRNHYDPEVTARMRIIDLMDQTSFLAIVDANHHY